MISPDIVILAVEWRTRALLRAQLIEDGLEVIATNTWALFQEALLRNGLPRAAIIDLQNLDDPLEVLRAVTTLMPKSRIVALAALGTLPQAQIDEFGVRVLERPV